MIVKTLILIGLSLALAWHAEFLGDFSTKLVRVRHTVIFSCREIPKIFAAISKLFESGQYFRFVRIGDVPVNLNIILTRHLTASTCVVLDLNCLGAFEILNQSSFLGSFNKSYQWLLIDDKNIGMIKFIDATKGIGLNSQVSYVNITATKKYQIYDLYSKGQHLKSPLITARYAAWSNEIGFKTSIGLADVQGRFLRDNFQGLTLRGVVVIDRDDTEPSKFDKILSNPTKSSGISQFTKYHYTLVKILQQLFNFTINYRLVHSWAGRLPGSQYRIGMMGVMQRNEADIAASGAFNRINRFAEVDTIHQSWKFETAFLYRMTSDLKDSSSGGGSFLAPFEKMVWILGSVAVVVVIVIWKILTIFDKGWRNESVCEKGVEESVVLFNSLGILCQQGFQKSPKNMAVRIVAFALMIFSLLMYNFYTSSVVGGLLSTDAKGPGTLVELIQSPLIISFEDIGYHKVLFRESNSSIVKQMYREKVRPNRNPNILPAYVQANEAVSYLRSGLYAYHGELVHVYPEIAKRFEANEICDLRAVFGLFGIEDKLLNMILTKRSSYTEMFRIGMHRIREIGLINRELKVYRTEKPLCQSGSTVHPVTLNGVINAFIILGVGITISAGLLVLEMSMAYIRFRKKQKKLQVI